jgi:hypothetical protein
MIEPDAVPEAPGSDHPYRVEIEAERQGWYELASLVRSVPPEECRVPGYNRDPDWTVREVVAHIGTWLAEAQVQFERMSSGTYEDHDVDIDTLNAQLLEAMADQPGEVAWLQANAGRTRMLEEWYRLRDPSEQAAWWIRKGAAEHFAELIDRLREWTSELIGRRSSTART